MTGEKNDEETEEIGGTNRHREQAEQHRSEVPGSPSTKRRTTTVRVVR